jgi:hypothetical protein
MKPERSLDNVSQQDDVSEACIVYKLEIMVGEFELKLRGLSGKQRYKGLKHVQHF